MSNPHSLFLQAILVFIHTQVKVINNSLKSYFYYNVARNLKNTPDLRETILKDYQRV